MLQLSHLEQFKQEVMNLGYGILQKPDKLYALNTVKHKMILVELMQLICVDAEKNSLEEQCLIEIRRLWIMHMLLLASVRNKYKQLNYKKLDRPKEFTYELDLPAFIELQGSATPADNPKIVLDENQQIYLQS